MLLNRVVIDTRVVNQLVCNCEINNSTAMLFILLDLYHEYHSRTCHKWICQYKC